MPNAVKGIPRYVQHKLPMRVAVPAFNAEQTTKILPTVMTDGTKLMDETWKSPILMNA